MSKQCQILERVFACKHGGSYLGYDDSPVQLMRERTKVHLCRFYLGDGNVLTHLFVVVMGKYFVLSTLTTDVVGRVLCDLVPTLNP